MRHGEFGNVTSASPTFDFVLDANLIIGHFEYNDLVFAAVLWEEQHEKTKEASNVSLASRGAAHLLRVSTFHLADETRR